MSPSNACPVTDHRHRAVVRVRDKNRMQSRCRGTNLSLHDIEKSDGQAE